MFIFNFLLSMQNVLALIAIKFCYIPLLLHPMPVTNSLCFEGRFLGEGRGRQRRHLKITFISRVGGVALTKQCEGGREIEEEDKSHSLLWNKEIMSFLLISEK